MKYVAPSNQNESIVNSNKIGNTCDYGIHSNSDSSYHAIVTPTEVKVSAFTNRLLQDSVFDLHKQYRSTSSSDNEDTRSGNGNDNYYQYNDSYDTYYDDEETLQAMNPDRLMYTNIPFIASFAMENRIKYLHNALISIATHTGIDSKGTRQPVKGEYSHHNDKQAYTMPMVMAVLVTTLTQFQIGYTAAILNAASIVMYEHYTILQWSSTVSSYPIGGLLGSLIGSMIAVAISRRWILLINIFIFLLGGLVTSLHMDISILALGCFLLGISGGIGSIITPLYLGEISVPGIRGNLGMYAEYASMIGFVVGCFLSLSLSPSLTVTSETISASTSLLLLRYLFAAISLVSIVQLMLSSYIVESPVWLLTKNPNSIVAQRIIRRIRNLDTDDQVREETGNIIYALYKNHAITSNSCNISISISTNNTSNGSTATVWELLVHPTTRISVLLCFFVQLLQQFSGISIIFYYSNILFDDRHSLIDTLVIAIFNIIGVFLSFKMMVYTIKKRSLLLFSCFGMIIGVVLSMIALVHQYDHKLVLLSLLIIVIFYNFGMYAIPSIMIFEFFDIRHVTTAMCASIIIKWIGKFSIVVTFLILKTHLHTYFFLPFLLLLLIGFAGIHVFSKDNDADSNSMWLRNNEDIRRYQRQCSSSSDDVDGNAIYDNSGNHNTSIDDDDSSDRSMVLIIQSVEIDDISIHSKDTA